MNFRWFNVATGVTSVAPWPRLPYLQAVTEARELAAWRAEEEGFSMLAAMELSFRERRAGQLAYTTSTLGVLGLTLGLATRTDAPDWLLCLLALIPSASYLGALVYERTLRRAWRR